MGGYFAKKRNKNTKLHETRRVEHEAYLMHEALKCLTGEFTHAQFLQECLPTSKTQGSVPFFSKKKCRRSQEFLLPNAPYLKPSGFLPI